MIKEYLNMKEGDDVFVISDDSDNEEKDTKEAKSKKAARKISIENDEQSEKRTSQRKKKPRVSNLNYQLALIHQCGVFSVV